MAAVGDNHLPNPNRYRAVVVPRSPNPRVKLEGGRLCQRLMNPPNQQHLINLLLLMIHLVSIPLPLPTMHHGMPSGVLPQTMGRFRAWVLRPCRPLPRLLRLLPLPLWDSKLILGTFLSSSSTSLRWFRFLPRGLPNSHSSSSLSRCRHSRPSGLILVNLPCRPTRRPCPRNSPIR